MRAGLIGKKLGMTRMLGADGLQRAVTVIKIEPHEVIGHKTVSKHGYEAVVVGTIEVAESKLTKPECGVFKALGTKFFRIVREFRMDGFELPVAGTIFDSEHFLAGQFVDVSGVSIGKGYAGPMKRHNFGGLRASHGVSVSHRSHGSTGNRTEPGKVFKGKKMAGHLGDCRVTIQNLKIYGSEDGLLLIEGAVPGAEGGYVVIRDSVKKRKQQ